MARKAQQGQQQGSTPGTGRAGGGRAHGGGGEGGAPIPGYDEMSQQEAMEALDSLSADELEQLVLYEAEHRNRVGIVKEINRRLEEGDNEDVEEI